VQIIVSLPDQRIKVYQGTQLVASSRVSSGKAGYRTPSGVFSILEKKRRHYSNLYGGAPMPHMQRLTWSGVALHASGSVPGYAASHGCVRLRPSFARQLFGFTQTGAHVIVANQSVEPIEITHSKLFQPWSGGAKVALGVATPQIEGDGAATITRAKSSVGELAALLIPQTAHAATLSRVTSVEKTNDDGLASGEAKPMPSTSPIRILVTRRTGRERMLDVQQILFELGYEPGDIDGYVGRDTVTAIKKFQEAAGLAANGTVSDELIETLYRAAGKGEVHQGHIYVRQDFKALFDAPVTIREPGKSLGTHVMTVMHFEDDATEARWLGLTLKHRAKKPRRSRRAKKGEARSVVPVSTATASEALDRIEIPDRIRARISQILKPGSSMVISDKGLGPETGKGTDFIALTF
jgi:peptidoglycan hydrolase-like protein with peptidoglycan-binding domain